MAVSSFKSAQNPDLPNHLGGMLSFLDTNDVTLRTKQAKKLEDSWHRPRLPENVVIVAPLTFDESDAQQDSFDGLPAKHHGGTKWNQNPDLPRS